jgi:hypothetical protein
VMRRLCTRLDFMTVDLKFWWSLLWNLGLLSLGQLATGAQCVVGGRHVSRCAVRQVLVAYLTAGREIWVGAIAGKKLGAFRDTILLSNIIY